MGKNNDYIFCKFKWSHLRSVVNQFHVICDENNKKKYMSVLEGGTQEQPGPCL